MTILREDVDPMCHVCGKEVESVDHLASGCTGLAGKEYRRRHDRMELRGVMGAVYEVRVSEVGDVEI